MTGPNGGNPADPHRPDEVTVRITGRQVPPPSGPPRGGPPPGPPPSGPPPGPPPGGPPPGGPPPGWSYPVPPPGRSSALKWWAVGAAVLAVIAVTVAVVVTLRPDGGGGEAPPAVASGEQSAGEFGDAAETSAPADAPDLIETAGLEALLPENSELLSFLGLPADRQVTRYERPMKIDYDADVHNCGPVASPYEASAYRGSGYTAVRYSFVRDPDDDHSPFIQRVWAGGVAFHSAEAAEAMYAKLAGMFESCAGRTVNLKTADQDYDNFWGIGAVTKADGVISVLNFEEGANDWRCAHSVAQRSNVMVDVVDCSRGATIDRSVELVKQMMAKIEAPQ